MEACHRWNWYLWSGGWVCREISKHSWSGSSPWREIDSLSALHQRSCLAPSEGPCDVRLRLWKWAEEPFHRLFGAASSCRTATSVKAPAVVAVYVISRTIQQWCTCHFGLSVPRNNKTGVFLQFFFKKKLIMFGFIRSPLVEPRQSDDNSEQTKLESQFDKSS